MRSTNAFLPINLQKSKPKSFDLYLTEISAVKYWTAFSHPQSDKATPNSTGEHGRFLIAL